MQQTLNNSWQQTYSSIIEAGTAKSTRRAYARDVIYFWRWTQLALQQGEHYPVSEESVIQFVLDHIGHMAPALEKQLIKEGSKRHSGALKIPTLRRYLASLSCLLPIKRPVSTVQPSAPK